ncbi:MAG: sigma-70 family RNA polymerase sigma factor [Saprospiraceae bacterium]|nr:sigma-70 family RNA polymerase sigma factor [Saprospiraceae bacterium]
METHTLSTKATEDYALVQEAVAGNQKAYAQLMTRYRQSVFHAILKMVNNREDAEDLTLEAFGKAFNKLGSYTPNFAFSTWLFKIAVNNCIDYMRKKRLHTLSLDEPVEAGSKQEFSDLARSGGRDPEQELIREQRVEVLRQLINGLNDKYRLMVELRYYEQLSYEEIAQELAIPLGTVKAQLFRAKELLSAQLKRPGASAFVDLPVGFAA